MAQLTNTGRSKGVRLWRAAVLGGAFAVALGLFKDYGVGGPVAPHLHLATSELVANYFGQLLAGMLIFVLLALIWNRFFAK